MSDLLRVILIEDSKDDALLIEAELRGRGQSFHLLQVEDERGFRAALENEAWDLVLADYSLPGFSAPAALRILKSQGFDVPFIIVSGAIGEETAVAAMKAGAHDYIFKGRLARLLPAIERELGDAAVRHEHTRMQLALRESESRLAAVVASAMDAIISIDDQQRIVMFNAAAEKMFGHAAETMLGQTLDRLLPPAARQDHHQRIAEFGASGQASRLLTGPAALVGLRADGEEFPAEISISQVLLGDRRILTAIVRDISERQRAESALHRSREELRALALRLHSGAEEERKKITRDIHDELGQALTGLKMDLAWMRRQLHHQTVTAAPLLAKIDSMSTHIDATAKSIRELCTELRPGILDDFGLVAAIEWQAREFTRRTGIRCLINNQADSLNLDCAAATTIFRIVQEVLTNVARHSQASRVRIALKATPHLLLLQAEDNGRGIKPGEVQGHKSLGLVGMRERALALGGLIEIRPANRGGTLVTLTVPLNESSRRPPHSDSPAAPETSAPVPSL